MLSKSFLFILMPLFFFVSFLPAEEALSVDMLVALKKYAQKKDSAILNLADQQGIVVGKKEKASFDKDLQKAGFSLETIEALKDLAPNVFPPHKKLLQEMNELQKKVSQEQKKLEKKIAKLEKKIEKLKRKTDYEEKSPEVEDIKSLFLETDYFSIRNVRLNGGKNIVSLPNGGKVKVSLEFNFLIAGGSMGTINQIIGGLGGEKKAQVCLWQGGNSSYGWKSTSFYIEVPKKEGVYYLRTRYAQAYNAYEALSWWKVDRPKGPTSKSNIAAIIVGHPVTSTSSSNSSPGSWVKITENNKNYRAHLVHRRVVFGFPGHKTVTVNRNKRTWTEVSKTYGPFSYGANKPVDGATRKWRLYAVYWDENSGGSTNVQIKFDLPGDKDPVFTLPRVAGGWGWNADAYSNWFQFGKGTAEEIMKQHAICYARLNSSAPYDNHGQVFWLELLAYDVFPE